MKLQSVSTAPRTSSYVKPLCGIGIGKAAATTELTEKTPHFPRHGALSEGKGGYAFLASRRPANLVPEPCPDRHPSRQHSFAAVVFYLSCRHAATGDQTLFPSLYSQKHSAALFFTFSKVSEVLRRKLWEKYQAGARSTVKCTTASIRATSSNRHRIEPGQRSHKIDKTAKATKNRACPLLARISESVTSRRPENRDTSRTSHTRVLGELTTTCRPQWLPRAERGATTAR